MLGSGCGSTPAPRRTDVYLYEDTRRLVMFVESAAALVEQRRTAAFDEFDRAGSRCGRFRPACSSTTQMAAVCGTD